MIEQQRIRRRNDASPGDGRYVLYWMQQSQRAMHNPALEYAIERGDELDVPVVVVFGLYAAYPDANRRHFAFMLEGLAETASVLTERGIKLLVRLGEPPQLVAGLAADAALLVWDRGYLRRQRRWRDELVDALTLPIIEVEGDVVVPVECASDKREWAARTIRPKIVSRQDDFIRRLDAATPGKSSLPLDVTGDVDVRDWRRLLDELDVDDSVAPSPAFRGGTNAARDRITAFLRSALPGYADARNDPATPRVSGLGPYLHFGQISPVEIAYKVCRSTSASDEDKAAFLEELIVRRELAVNFVFYTRDYDSYESLPDWARKTLAEHAGDERPVLYDRKRLEAADTDDPYWNAAMNEMRATGYMHNHMRMYWGKKILEWSESPQQAYDTALYLNNRYFLDGRDANSWTNVGWLFGLHDRAWTERGIFGKVRYMNARGLERKFDVGAYVDRVEQLRAADGGD